MGLSNGLLLATVSHTRLVPRHHHLRYRVYYLSFALSALAGLRNRLLGVNAPGFFSFHEKDHGFGEPGCERWARGVLTQTGLSGYCDGEIVLITMPRVLGYAFNPVSFWFCLDKAGCLRSVIAEVNNTFGERHAYVCAHEDGREIAPADTLQSDKVFHVSPFLPVRGRYHFRFRYAADAVGVWIDYEDEAQRVLTTALTGKRVPLSAPALLRCFFTHPLLTLKVIVTIHLHALRMVLKGFRYHPKPPLTAPEVSR
jgi:DUF1365 family protein